MVWRREVKTKWKGLSREKRTVELEPPSTVRESSASSQHGQVTPLPGMHLKACGQPVDLFYRISW